METNTVYLQQVGLVDNKSESSRNCNSTESVTNIELSEVKQPSSDQYTYQIVKICQEKPWMSAENQLQQISLPLYSSYGIAPSSANNHANFCNKPGLMFHKMYPEMRNNNNSGVFPISMGKESSDPLDLTLSSVEASSRNFSEVAKDFNMQSSFSGENNLKNGSAIDSSFPHQFTSNDVFVNGFSKKRGRKRKYTLHLDDTGDFIQCVSPNHAMPREQIEVAKQAEVLVAAKSLFSKRTRTLYHWIHPEMSKAQIKSDVNAAWELLPPEQREFYISQVLGKFGFPQCSLMINPQLKKLPNEDQVAQPSSDNDETKNAVSGLILSENCEDWQQQAFNKPNRKKRHSGRLSANSNNSSVKNPEADMIINPEKLLADVEDDFQDDPELSREFQQFKWTLLYNNN